MYAGTYYGQTYYGDTYPSYGTGSATYAFTGALSGSGVETSSLSNTEVETGSLLGSAAVTSSLGNSELDSAAFSGTSAVTGSLANIELETASLSGVSSVAATVSISAPVTSTLSGTSSTSSALSDTDPEASTISGAGVETSAISNTVLLSSALAGSSLFSSSFSGTQTLSATLSGSAAVVATVGDASTVSSAEVGASSLTSILSDSEQFSAALSGTSSVAASTNSSTVLSGALGGGSAIFRANIIANGSFETDLTGWLQYGGSPLSTFAQDTAHVQFGTQAMKLTASAVADGQGQFAGAQYNLSNLQIGAAYTFSVYIYSTVATTGGQVNLYHGSGGLNFNNSTDIAVGWNRLSLSMAPGGTSGGVYIRFKGVANQVYWIDGAMVEIGSNLNTYIDGGNGALLNNSSLIGSFNGGSQLGRQNLILNPSFETDTPGNLNSVAGWSLYGVNPTYKGVIAQNATYGANTFKVSAASITDCGIQYVATGLTIGQTYTLSAYLKTDSTVVNANLILDTSQGIGGFMTRGSNSGANVNQRVSVTMTVDRTSCNVYMGQGSFGSNSFGNVWWDGVMLEVGLVAGSYIEGNQLSVSVSEAQGGTLAGSSSVTSAIAIAGALGSSMVGASSLTATISDREVEAGTLSGSGTVAGLVTDTESVNASESGSSSVIGTVSDLENVTTALTGSSTVGATLATSGVFGATLVGSSVVGATIIDTETQSAPISGIASIIAALSDVEALSASLVGTSTVAASLSLFSTGVAAVAGASTTTVTFGADIDPTLAAVLGYGSLSATLSVTTPGRGSLLLLGIG